MLDQDPGEGRFRLAALQSPAGRRLLAACGRSPDDISSIVLVEAFDGPDSCADGSQTSSRGKAGTPEASASNSGRQQPGDLLGGTPQTRRRLRHHIKSEAVLRIASGLPNGFPLLAMFGMPFPSMVRDGVYDLVADNRYAILGRRDMCRLSDKGFEGRFIST